MAHPDDPRPVREHLARTNSAGRVVPVQTNNTAVQGPQWHPWRPASWHKPLGGWWGPGGEPLVPLPVMIGMLVVPMA